MARDMLSKSAGGSGTMAAASSSAPIRRIGENPEPVTLLDLVRAVGEVTANEDEIVETVRHMLRTRLVRLGGILRDVPLDEL